MTHYIGLDAHSKTCTAVVTDKTGKILQKSQFPTSEKHLLQWLQGVPRPRILAFEEMNISHWLFIVLKDHVDELVIAHAPHLKKQRGAKTDLIDATRLATELRCGTITKVFHEDSKLWDLRVLVNSYQDVTKDLTRIKPTEFGCTEAALLLCPEISVRHPSMLFSSDKVVRLIPRPTGSSWRILPFWTVLLSVSSD